MTTQNILSEVRGILDDKPSAPAVDESGSREPEAIDEATGEKYGAAARMIRDYGTLKKVLGRHMDAVDKAFAKAQKDLAGMKKIGAGDTEAVTLLKPAIKELRKLGTLVDRAVQSANKATGLKEDVELNGMPFANQGNGLWEEPVVGAPTATPNNSVAGAQMANAVKGANALMNAKKGKVVKMGGVGYRVTQKGQPFKVGSNTVSILTLGGAYGGGRGDQYAMLVPSGSPGATIKLVNLASATPTFRDVKPDLTVEDDEGDLPLASRRTDETQVWTPADPNEVAVIVKAVYQGEDLRHHTEEQDRDPAVIKGLRRAVREGIAIKVEGVQVPVHNAARILSLYDGLGIPNQAKLSAMSIDRMLDVVEKTTADTTER